MRKVNNLNVVFDIIEIVVGIVAVYTIVMILGASSPVGIISMIFCADVVASDIYTIVVDTDALNKVLDKVSKIVRNYWKR